MKKIIGILATVFVIILLATLIIVINNKERAELNKNNFKVRIIRNEMPTWPPSENISIYGGITLPDDFFKKYSLEKITIDGKNIEYTIENEKYISLNGLKSVYGVITFYAKSLENGKVYNIELTPEVQTVL